MDSPTSHPTLTRQKAYSDSYIQLPRNLTFMDVGLPIEETPSTSFHRIQTIPSSLELMTAAATEEEQQTPPPTSIVCYHRFHPLTIHAHTVALHFIFHLLLISLFETLFFWLFVSRQEDSALTGLVNTYTGRAFATCATMTPLQRADLRDWVSLFFNTSTALEVAAEAAAERQAFNAALLRNSWLYFGGLATGFGLLTSTAHLRGLHVRWPHLIGENLALVTFLGLYEWMFFRTVALQYRAVTPAELDGMIVTEFLTDC